MESTVENFIIKPFNAWGLINYLKTLNSNQAYKLVGQIWADVFWIEKGAFKKDHKDDRYVTRAKTLMKVIQTLLRKRFFAAELTPVGNELIRLNGRNFEDFHTEYLNGFEYEWLYGDSINCCACIESEGKVVSFCEGDVCEIICKTPELFAAERQRALDWAKEDV